MTSYNLLIAGTMVPGDLQMADAIEATAAELVCA
jgi:hypothetical protein